MYAEAGLQSGKVKSMPIRFVIQLSLAARSSVAARTSAMIVMVSREATSGPSNT